MQLPVSRRHLRGSPLPAAATSVTIPAQQSTPARPLVPGTLRSRKKQHALLLWCGSGTDPAPLPNTISADEAKCKNFDVLNGPLLVLADNIIFDQLICDVVAGEFSVWFARPDMSSFSRHHSQQCNAPRRKAEGPERYGCSRLLMNMCACIH